MENKITFGTLHPNGELTNVKQINQSMFSNCPFLIMMPDHYREDGSCKCNDPEERKMMKKEWGYTEKSFIKAGIYKNGLPSLKEKKKKKEKSYTVHFMTPYMTFENIIATSKEDAIAQCGDPPYEHDMNDFGMFVAIED